MLVQTHYKAELQRIEKDVADVRDTAFTRPIDTERVTKYAYGLYQHAVLTGSVPELESAETVIDQAIRLVGLPGDLHFLKANLAFKLHRLEDIRRHLAAIPSFAASAEVDALLADLDFQQGRYAPAKERYLRAIAADRTWDNLVRLAYFEFKMGDAAAADQLYAEAEDELTAKEMRSYAWVELQRGLLDLAHGRHAEAAAHYGRADRAYSGHWLVAEHTAELLGAQGRFEQAASLYEEVVARAPKPELQQALGELYSVMGEHARAQAWFESAREAYLASTRRGGVHYYHHLADFCADVLKDGAEAVKWARKDIALRENFATQAALAWALHRDGQGREAAEQIDRALASGAKSAHLFSQAARIYAAAGRGEESDRCSQTASAINPHHRSFHVHR
jgi:tetratricopeptide (TPR) repeat protein